MSGREQRRHNETRNPSTDHREKHPAKRDRDRLLYSNALRRLAGVTQVVSPIEGDVVHNRLTHTLKVAQIARRLTERLLSETKQELISGVGGLDPEVAEAAALAHDLGHPPFGHIGEQELQRMLTEPREGEPEEEGYEGNAQSFRIVTRLAVRSEAHIGLNLTRATLDALLKYPWLHTSRPKERKWGAYETEQEDFTWVRLNGCDYERCVEAQIMDWADDITYAVHDVDDFFRAGIMPLHLLVRDDDERSKFLSATRERWRESNPGRIAQWEQYQDAFRTITGIMPIRGPYKGTRQEQAWLNKIGSELITRFINAPIIAEPQSGTCSRLEIPADIKAEVSILKALNWHYVIECSALKTQQHGLRRIVRELFRIYRDEDPGNLVPHWLAAELDSSASPARRAADIVSALSDSQALRMYQRLTGLAPGSIRDWV